MASVVQHIGFYFMNGVANTDGSGSKTTEVIQKIIQESPDFVEDTTFVSFQHNNAAPLEKLLEAAALAVAGTVAAIYSLYQELTEQGNNTTRLIGFVGACILANAGRDYEKMQENKNEIAKTLADRVSAFLDQDNANVANLILHSQGADVGYRSLELLSKYKERIRVVTLGAMITIPNNMCAQVTNYKFTNDWISQFLALPFEMIRELTDGMGDRDIIRLEKKGALAHAVNDYLQESSVKASLLHLLK